MMNILIGCKVFDFIISVFIKILLFGNDGILFVFGDFVGKGIFFIQMLVMIVFVLVLLSILNYFCILFFGIKYIGGFVLKIIGFF